MSQVTIYELHGRLLQDTFDAGLSDADAFLLFALFHYYGVELAGPVLSDRPALGAGTRISAETQRGCAQALASLWPDRAYERSNYAYWYHRWNSDWDGDRRAENLTQNEIIRLRELMALLQRHPFVRSFIPEDDGLLPEERP